MSSVGQKVSRPWLLLLILFSGLVTSGGSLLHEKLYWDTGRIFLQFRDQLHSLNVFGEPAYWFPQYQMGAPGFYHSILGIPSCLQPAFGLVGLVVWVLGRLGIILTKYQPVYVLYFGFLIPGIFLHALSGFARTFYSSIRVQKYILILGAFSPGILFNFSDVGYLEASAYGLYFVTAVISVLRSSRSGVDRRSYFTLFLSSTALGLSLNHAFLYWNLFAIPLFALVIALVRGKRSLQRVMLFPRMAVIGIMVSFLIGFLPNYLTLKEGKELVRSSLLETKEYPLERLAPGNPLEMLTSSLSGFGFDWNADRTQWSLMPLSDTYHSAYSYLGILCMPFFFWGLLRGRRVVRNSILLFVTLFFAILSLSAYSPFFATLLAIPTPLRSCNHFSDAAFKAGSYLILILGAAEGFHAFWERNRRKGFLWVLLAVVVMNTALHYRYHPERLLGSFYIGMMGFLAVAFGVLLFQKRTFAFEKNLFIFLCLLDVSTHSFLWVRNVWGSKLIMNSGWPAYHQVDETPREDGLGLKVGWHQHFYANTLLLYRSYFEMLRTQHNPYHLPYIALFEGGHKSRDLDTEFKEGVLGFQQGKGSLPLEGGVLPIRPAGRVQPVPLRNEHKTYNAWKFETAATFDGWLFVRDAFSPHWRARVDGVEVPITRAYFNFRAIPLTKGSHSVDFQYFPMHIAATIGAAYLWLVLCFIGYVFYGLSRSAQPGSYPAAILRSA